MFKETAAYVVNIIADDLLSPLRRGVQLPPAVQFLVVLRFYATGSFQVLVGDVNLVCQPTVSNLVKRVSRALAKRRSLFLKFPDQGNVNIVRQKFYQIAGFPGK